MSNKIQAVVLAGGKGTRLAPITDTIPKPLVPVKGKPICDYVLEHLKEAGITRVALSIAHMSDQIKEYYGDGSQIGMEISYVVEPQPMGTGGWTQLIDWEELEDEVLVLNADNIFWIDIEAFVKRHREVGGVATIAAVELPSEQMSAAELLLHSGSELMDYVDREDSEPYLKENDTVFISSGWYVLNPKKVRPFIEEKSPISMEQDVWPALAKGEEPIGFYPATEPWFDTGTHERLARIEQFLDETTTE